ncbi:MAG: pilus assembly protein N-terminal domain-containing protein [Alphaproteobacteria bacterium]|nr:pilus assembly protein N-terminal domain-containing protein [Alphaproteobacteria bacterium]
MSNRQALRLGAAVLALGCALAAPARADEFVVSVDQARMQRIPETASAVIVGNPAIADAYVQEGNLLFILGRSFGITNVIALSPEGKEIANLQVVVQTRTLRDVTVYRGPNRFSYACAGKCESVLRSGDEKLYFEELGKQVQTKADIAQKALGKGND